MVLEGRSNIGRKAAGGLLLEGIDEKDQENTTTVRQNECDKAGCV